MSGFLLETLAGRTWKRDGQTFWTRVDAEREAKRTLRRGKAVMVRVLPVEVGTEAVSTFSADAAKQEVHADA